MLITNEKQADDYYQALLKRKPSYVGIFFVGVKTTSIFCIATCRARKPKRENVAFYTHFKDAMDAGFRPCKICRPTENANEAPHEVQMAMDLVRDCTKAKITDQQLVEAGIRPIFLRRWFNQHYGMTFQTFQRMYRINYAFKELKSGKTATNTALDSGYDSLSGFGYTFKKLLGHSPSLNMENSVILIDRLTTPIGPMFVCATEKGICLLEFVDRRMLESEFEDLQKRLKATIITGENQHTKQLKQELEAYFSGARKNFTVPLQTPGTDFQNQVWQALGTIPYGETASYQEQAIRLNNPKAVRAVARANGMNRIAIIIPCHRVIGKDGSLTGYAGGLERKRWLLDHEKAHS
ncbi:bifunctional transcriptional activator/DNA repair enzyme AdaA [Marinomonas transparens]|uniref:Methylated-DNA--protein-cysteine methyltransferase n=1 Tax=Marinomonas transparens TaxID=2795388 RepID=A0A934JKY0_9GAMM|nr:bifunctional transcriptional activator/DNA repair protein Ada [Marinomonas transparens]MBJ7536278.1 bifunctional transcriptional activator/DNA repair protein Ada [Marinomonas transparens]